MVLSSKGDYAELKTYLNGYLDGWGLATNTPIHSKITTWLSEKSDVHTSTSWTDLVLHLSKNNKDTAYKLLLDELEEWSQTLD